MDSLQNFRIRRARGKKSELASKQRRAMADAAPKLNPYLRMLKRIEAARGEKQEGA
jgi:hypothetical protein